VVLPPLPRALIAVLSDSGPLLESTTVGALFEMARPPRDVRTVNPAMDITGAESSGSKLTLPTANFVDFVLEACVSDL
jgi:hypothetical protein